MIESFFYHLGALVRLLLYLFRSLREIRKISPQFIQNLDRIGIGSIPLVVVASAFTGMVASVQTAYQVRDYVPLDFLGAGVAKAIMIELGPVLTALIIAGRVGAGIAAELGTMRVTEQIDALEVMAIDPVRFLVLPRVLAGIIVVPLLTVLGEAVSIIGAAIVSATFLRISYSTFFHGIRLFFLPLDLWGGLAKSLVFGLVITLIGCHFGFNAERGAKGVGKATTLAVVFSSLLILMFDYILGTIIFG